jgi:hypothetical protein
MKNHLRAASTLFFLGPIVATIMGLIAVTYFEIPSDVFFTNAIGIVVGIPLAMLVIFKWKKRIKKELLIAAFSCIGLMAICFFFPGINMVYRWIQIGTVDINVSMIVLPLVLYSINQLLREHFVTYALVILCVTGLILSMQPDAGQLSAFGVAALVMFAMNKIPWTIRLGALLIVGLVGFLGWNRVDLLEPVDQVQDVLVMIYDFGPVGYLGLFVVLAAAFYPFIHFAIKGERVLSIAFIFYLITQLIVTELGNYPVPLLGAGGSAIIGWYLMLGLAPKNRHV